VEEEYIQQPAATSSEPGRHTALSKVGADDDAAAEEEEEEEEEEDMVEEEAAEASLPPTSSLLERGNTPNTLPVLMDKSLVPSSKYCPMPPPPSNGSTTTLKRSLLACFRLLPLLLPTPPSLSFSTHSGARSMGLSCVRIARTEAAVGVVVKAASNTLDAEASDVVFEPGPSEEVVEEERVCPMGAL